MRVVLKSSLVAICLTCSICGESQAGISTPLLKKTIQTLQRKFGREIVEEFGESGSRSIARKIEALAAKHGDDLVTDAVQKVGPRMFRYIEDVGEDGALKCLKLMRRTGDDAIWIVSKPGRTSIFLKYGDDAADAMIKHGEIAEEVVSKFGTAGAQALRRVNNQSARRLAIMTETGELARTANPDGILRVIARYGNRASTWVWKNKGSLAVAAVAASFINNPEPYLSGVQSVGEAVAEHVVEPIATTAAKSVDWTWLGTLGALSGTVIVLCWAIFRRPRQVGTANG